MRILSLAILSLGLSLTVHADYPENTAYIPDDAIYASRVSRDQFVDAIKMVKNAYSAELLLKEGCTLRIYNKWSSPIVNAYASRRGNFCDVEMHGGFARYPGNTKGGVVQVLCHEVGHHVGGAPKYSGGDWASCEGQSDYWAQECAKHLLGKAGARTSGLVIGYVLADLMRENKPSYSTPDQSRANGIYCSHPGSQCRVDTYLAGIEGTRRPACWYNP